MEIPTLNSAPRCHLAAGDSRKREGWNFLVDVLLGAARMGFWGKMAMVQSLSWLCDWIQPSWDLQPSVVLFSGCFQVPLWFIKTCLPLIKPPTLLFARGDFEKGPSNQDCQYRCLCVQIHSGLLPTI